MPLTNKLVVLVGATGQLGPVIAARFAAQGVKLVLVGTHSERLEALRVELGYSDTRVFVHLADATSTSSMQELADLVRDKYGGADILLHTAGGYRGGSLVETSNETWDYLLELNLRTAVNSIRAFLPHLVAKEWGRILTISSGITQAPPANAVAYATAKAALETLTLAVAQEGKERGVTANVVLIRALDTPAERAKQPDKKTGWVKPDDVAATLLFLCSEEGGAITGARIPVFGGN